MSRADQSLFYIPCVCGTTVRSHKPETQCESCGRWLVVEWGKTAEGEAKREQKPD